MTRIDWDGSGNRLFETGVDRGVLFIPNGFGVYDTGVPWNGLTTVTESPSGAEATPQWADNIKYLNLVSREEFGATIEAYTYPDAFAQCDGSAEPQPGVRVNQQNRKPFGFCYRTLLGDDQVSTDKGYKLHLVYGALAAPTEKAHATVNDSPEALAFSWSVTTSPVAVTGLKPTASLEVDSTKVAAGNLSALEDALYGTAGTSPRLPLPDEVITMLTGALTAVTPLTPAYVSGTHTITVPSVTGVTYKRMDTGATVAGGATIVLTVGQTLVLKATPANGYKFTPNSDDDWSIAY